MARKWTGFESSHGTVRWVRDIRVLEMNGRFLLIPDGRPHVSSEEDWTSLAPESYLVATFWL